MSPLTLVLWFAFASLVASQNLSFSTFSPLPAYLTLSGISSPGIFFDSAGSLYFSILEANNINYPTVIVAAKMVSGVVVLNYTVEPSFVGYVQVASRPIVVDSQGILYIVNLYNPANLLRFLPNGTQLSSLPLHPYINTYENQIEDMIIDAQDNIYIQSTGAGIFKVNKTGDLLAFNTNTTAFYANGIALDPVSGNLYATSDDSRDFNLVAVYNSSLSLLRTFTLPTALFQSNHQQQGYSLTFDNKGIVIHRHLPCWWFIWGNRAREVCGLDATNFGQLHRSADNQR